MAEALGTALAVVGVLGQLFDGCVKAYGMFTRAAQFDADSAKLACKMRIEEMRLVVWGREWGVAEGRLEAHLDGLHHHHGPSDVVAGGNAAAMRQLALQILTELHRTITDFQRLRERYGLTERGREELESEQGSEELAEREDGGRGQPGSEMRGQKRGSREGLARKPGAAGKKGGLEKTGIWTRELTMRAKWVIADKEKFETLLKDLRDYNDGLERLFPPSRQPSLQRTWVLGLLQTARQDVDELSQLEDASNGIYPKLNASAGLKRLRINLDATPQKSFSPTFAFKVQRQSLTVSDKDPKRSQGYHDPSGAAVIEWVEYDKTNLDEKFVHMRRLDDLARMMQSATDRHPDLHTIDCLGYTDDTTMSRYGLVYKAPEGSFSTLHSIIASDDLKTPDLDERMKLARTLSVALWSLHSLDWLHKSLCSNNILFFPSACSAAATRTTANAAMVPDISSPFLVGFDASRPDSDTEMSVASRNPSILDLHRHPSSLKVSSRGLYCKSYDMYSLGLVLLEIGLWKVSQTYHKPHYTAQRWRDKVVLPVLVPGLGSKTGRVYREVVERCLNAKDDISSDEAGELMESVVRTLEGINV